VSLTATRVSPALCRCDFKILTTLGGDEARLNINLVWHDRTIGGTDTGDDFVALAQVA
jgi:hypothetical protein